MVETILLEFRKTRRALWAEYGSGLFLFLLLAMSYAKGVNLPPKGYLFVGGLGLGAIIWAEGYRMLYKYTITKSKILINYGLLRRTRRYIYINSISDLDVKQTRIERLLNYGTIHLRATSGESSLELTNIGNPHQIMELVEQQMEGHVTPLER